ncbi:hypothetical protein [Elioraea rosea]|uniref:hypothetical protein n=1 Tax=Elioraea rosea TaxID=2492390 RepID=UPI0011835B42|nr:hypothetical protein [Elioraea rosea]
MMRGGRERAHTLFLGLALLLPGAAVAQGSAPTATGDLYGILRESVGSFGASVLFLGGGALLGAALKWGFDQLSAKRAKQRDFVENTGKRVVDLAWSHYWALANATGMLARPLTHHLRRVDAHLLVSWSEPAQLQARLREIADDTARASFIAFVRVLHTFERFQFRGSNTYLLPHHAAGETLRRLYNRFVESLGDELNASLTPIRLAVERKLTLKDKDGRDDPRLDLGSPQFDEAEWFTVMSGQTRVRTAAADRDVADIARDLDRARARYAEWLRTQPAAVADAADSLHAFSQLLTHELALLHAVWHQDRGLRAKARKLLRRDAAVTTGGWPGVLDPRAEETIRLSRSVSSFYSPLGGAGAAPEPPGEAAPAPQPSDSGEAGKPAATAPAGGG